MSQSTDIALPLSSDSWNYLGNESQRLRQEYLLNITNENSGSSSRYWAEESFNIVTSIVYDSMTDDENTSSINGNESRVTNISEAYLLKSLKVSER